MCDSNEKSLAEELFYQKKSFYETADEQTLADMQRYAEDYKHFLDVAKTEREAVEEGVKRAEQAGYTPFRFGEKLMPGDKRYYNNRGKNLFLIRKGSLPLCEDGVRILAAHIDSPRIDIKQNPLYEEGQMAFFKTHYYGGIRKYQWMALPLALHGTVVRRDGTAVNVRIGEDANDPVFYINDLLPHLAQEQASRPLANAVPGESLNILVGGFPCPEGDTGEKIRLSVMKILHEKYGMEERDFQSAELCAVPAFSARDIGFDRALIGAYGHDDRVCAYPAMQAVLQAEDGAHTLIAILADKEETGSDGNTGMQCRLLLDLIDHMAEMDDTHGAAVRAVSCCLSADVNAAFDPNFADVYEKRNAAMLSCGAVMSKYTGSRGKSSTNDASAEFVGKMRCIMDKAGVAWQTAELGKVDIGGGGTVAKYIANLNIDTVDIGVPVISMHAPYEVISKADLYALAKIFAAFCQDL